MKNFLSFYICCVTFCLLAVLRPALAQDPVIVGEVVTGETGYELPVQVENLNNEPLAGVKVGVLDTPQGLTNFKVVAPGTANLAPGKTAVYTVQFDVAEDAAAQEFAVISLSISADNGEFENPSPQIAVTVIKKTETEGDETEVSDMGNELGEILRLVEVRWESSVRKGEKEYSSYNQGESGFKWGWTGDRINKGKVVVGSVGLTSVPLEIILGASFTLQGEAYESEEWATTGSCGGGFLLRRPRASVTIKADKSYPEVTSTLGVDFEGKQQKLECPSPEWQGAYQHHQIHPFTIKFEYVNREGSDRFQKHNYLVASKAEGEERDLGIFRITKQIAQVSSPNGAKEKISSSGLRVSISKGSAGYGELIFIYRLVSDGDSYLTEVPQFITPGLATSKNDDQVSRKTLKLVKIEGPAVEASTTGFVHYIPGEAGFSALSIGLNPGNIPTGPQYLGSIQVVNPPQEIELGRTFQLEIDAQYMYQRRIEDCPVGYQSFGPPSIIFGGMSGLKGEEIQHPCPKENTKVTEVQKSQNVHRIIHFTPKGVEAKGNGKIYKYKAETRGKDGDGGKQYNYDISSNGTVFWVGLEARPVSDYLRSKGSLQLHYAPDSQINTKSITTIPPYQHPKLPSTSSDTVDIGPKESSTEEATKEDGKQGENISSTSEISDKTKVAPDPTRGINPQAPDIANHIKDWLKQAEHPENAKGAHLRYDKWGRFHGTAANGGIITLNGPPDNLVSPIPEVHAWAQRHALDSINLCMLEEYVIAKVEGKSLAHCLQGVASDGGTVPNLVGLKAKVATKRLQADGYKVKLQVGKAAATPKQAFTVAEMDPTPGSQLAAGKTIVVTVFNDAKKKAAAADLLPDLRGKKAKVAKKELLDKGYQVKIQAGEPAPAAQQAFTVKSMNPGPGTHLEKGEKVVLVVFVKPKNLIQLPNLVGISNLEAKKRLGGLGLKSTVKLQGNAPSIQQSFQVFKTEPPAHTKVATGSTVTIIAWKSFQQGIITAPNVMGMPINEAIQILKDLGLDVDTTRGKHAPEKVLEGRISSQTPLAGEQVAPNSEVELRYYKSYVWTGPVPDLNGLTLKQARQKLSEKKLEMDISRKRPTASSTNQVGRIFRQSPGTGSRAREGDKITVTVYGQTREQQVADHNCTNLLNVEPYWDSESQSPQCRCQRGYVIRTDRKGCAPKPAVTKKVPPPVAVEKSAIDWPGIRGLWRKDDGIEVSFEDEFNGYYEKVLFLSKYFFTKGELGYRVTKTGPDTYDMEVKWRWNNKHRKPYWKNSDLKIKDKNTMIEGGTMVWHRVNTYP